MIDLEEMRSNPEAKETLLNRVKNSFNSNNKLRIAIEWIGIGMMAFVAFIPRPLQVGNNIFILRLPLASGCSLNLLDFFQAILLIWDDVDVLAFLFGYSSFIF